VTEPNGIETALAADHTIHDVGSLWMASGSTVTLGAAAGYQDPLAFYFIGRGGVLGDVDADVVIAAFGWWEPGLARQKWELGRTVGHPHEAARHYAAACAAWGQRRSADLPEVDRFSELAGRVVASADCSGLPLFAGWRAEPLPAAGPGRVIHLVHLLRELRGGLHLIGTTAAGLTPLEAILTNEGPQQARFFGWNGDLPDVGAIKQRHDTAEQITNELAGAVYERALSEPERAEFVELVRRLGAAVLRN
jgi:hypothetical protein